MIMATRAERMRRNVRHYIIILFATVGLACGLFTPAGRCDELLLGLVIKTESNPFFVTIQEAAREKADELGVELRTFSGSYDGDTQAQIAAIEALVAAGAAGILITPSNPAALAGAVRRARAAGALVIALDTPFDLADTVDGTFATDNFRAGELIGRWARARLGNAATDARIVTLDSSGTQITVEVLRNQGFLKGFGIDVRDPEMMYDEDDMRLIGHGASYGSEEGGRAAMEELLQEHPAIDVVYALNEPAAAGAHAALQAVSREKDVLIVSIDGGCEGVAKVAAGTLGATAMQFPLRMAHLGVEAAVDYVRTGRLPERTPGLDFYDTGVTLVTDAPVPGIPSISAARGLQECWGLGSQDRIALRQNKDIEDVLPRIMRTMNASTVDAISGRIRQAYTDAPPATALSFGGASALPDALLAHGRTLETGTFEPGRLFAGSSFTLPLNAAGGGPMRNLTLWGSGDYRNISDGNQQAMAYDGDVVSASLGVDTRLGENLLAGMSMALARGTMDYTAPGTASGELTTSLSSINPYVGWQSPGGTHLWATGGYGWGRVEIEEATHKGESDLTQQLVAAGVSHALVSSEGLLPGGATSLRLNVETAFTRADVEGGDTLRSMILDASRHRMTFEGIHVRHLASKGTLTSSVEIGLGYDGGDGRTGAGLEVGAGLGYSAGRLAARLNTRTLLEYDGANEYDEWGVSGSLSYQPRGDGRGLSMVLGSTWGMAHGGVQSMWSHHDTRALARGKGSLHAAQRFHTELRYGLDGPPGRALWLPYFGADSGDGSRTLRLGVRLATVSGLKAGLEAGRIESHYGPTDHALELRGNFIF